MAKFHYTGNNNRIVRVDDNDVDALLDTIAHEFNRPYQWAFNAWLDALRQGSRWDDIEATEQRMRSILELDRFKR